MQLIIGLGNPGKKYQNNRHNVGYMIIDVLQKAELPNDVILKKTNVFMNESGSTVKKLIEKWKLKIENLYIIHDDLDIKLGDYKIQKGIGPKDHKGLNSIYESLPSKDFWHIRVGVDNRDLANRVSGEQYVLEGFEKDELVALKKVIIKLIPDLKQKF